MHILTFGDSSATGEFSGGTSWPDLLQAKLEAAGRGPLKVTKARLSVVGGSAAEYAEKKVGETSPDVVIITLGTFAFTAPFTWLRVQQLFGKRAGAWFRAIEENFDKRTRDETGTISPLNKFARRVLVKVLPGKTFSTREQTTERYREVFRALARFEDTQVLIMRYPGLTQYPKGSKMPAQRERFLADMKAAADTHRYAWIETKAAFGDADANAVHSDAVHLNTMGQLYLANALESAILGS